MNSSTISLLKKVSRPPISMDAICSELKNILEEGAHG